MYGIPNEERKVDETGLQTWPNRAFLLLRTTPPLNLSIPSDQDQSSVNRTMRRFQLAVHRDPVAVSVPA
jgi:hypothetical protein